jgi:hypothetical protein
VISIHRHARLVRSWITRVIEAARPQSRVPEEATTDAIQRPPGIRWPFHGVRA